MHLPQLRDLVNSRAHPRSVPHRGSKDDQHPSRKTRTRLEILPGKVKKRRGVTGKVLSRIPRHPCGCPFNIELEGIGIAYMLVQAFDLVDQLGLIRKPGKLSLCSFRPSGHHDKGTVLPRTEHFRDFYRRILLLAEVHAA